MLNIAVVDDEEPFRVRLCGFLDRYGQEHGLEMQVSCFQDGLDLTDEERFIWDIVFLDIQMDHLNGIETARRIRAADSSAILFFITSMAQYAIHGYEVDALDYILKPLEYHQFAIRMAKAVKEVDKRKAHSHVFLKKWNEYVKVSTDDIFYIEVSGHTLKYVTETGTYENRATIAEAEEQLEGLFFSRCSLSFLVNLKKIDRISRDTVYLGPYQLAISRTRKKQFLQAFTDYLEAGY